MTGIAIDLMAKAMIAFGVAVTVVLGVMLLSKLNELHLTMNSRLDQLIKASISQGRQDERDSQKGLVKMEEILKDKGLLP